MRRSKSHIVQRGETLSSIARKYNTKAIGLAKINGISPPYKIFKGQRLAIHNSGSTLTTQGKNPDNQNNNKKNYPYINNTRNSRINNNINNISNNRVSNISNNKTTDRYISNIINKNWNWPAKGRVVKNFIASGPNKINGLAIAGKKGDPVVSTARGKVVYSGNSLRGYGNLVIIKHDQDFLSAYAHNDRILVVEQQEVAQGQQIATMGNTDSKQVLLHFEIRHKGKPIDPKQVLAFRQP